MIDPNKILQKCRDASEIWISNRENDRARMMEWPDDLAESFRELDEWISKGGALPDAWGGRCGAM